MLPSDTNTVHQSSYLYRKSYKNYIFPPLIKSMTSASDEVIGTITMQTLTYINIRVNMESSFILFK